MKLKEQFKRWWKSLREWIGVKQLEHDLRGSRRFQKYCEKFNCPHLAASEKIYQAELTLKIREKKRRGTRTPATGQVLNLQQAEAK